MRGRAGRLKRIGRRSASMRARAWPARALLAMGCGVLQIAFVAWFAIRVVFSDLT